MAKKKVAGKKTAKTDVFNLCKAGHNDYRDRFQKFIENPQPHLKSKVVTMSPKEYMKVVEGWLGRKFNPGDRVQRILKIKLDQNKPNSWAVPVLDYSVKQYVGMNRAIACDRYGIGEIPVLIVGDVPKKKN